MRPNWLETLMGLLALGLMIVGVLTGPSCQVETLNGWNIQLKNRIEERREQRARQIREALGPSSEPMWHRGKE